MRGAKMNAIEQTLEVMDRDRVAIMAKLEKLVATHNALGFYGTARRYQRALIELHNCAPVTPFMRANGEKTGSRKKP